MQDAVAVVTSVPGVRWGVCLRIDGRTVTEIASTDVVPTASVGKVLLLLEVARRIESGELDPARRLAPAPDDEVADSGLWQHLDEPGLSVASLAVLVASVSDNLATNVLLREVGLDAVARVTGQCGLDRTRMLDRIRDHRGPEHPLAPSVGSADELARLMEAIADGTAVSPAVSARVAEWLALDVDTSLVAGGLALDPLAHLDGPVRLFHKTGWDAGIRADVGHVIGPRAGVAYAVLARWDPTASDRSVEVLEAMREVGVRIRQAVR